jgi:carboxyl-terminal processing protease
MATQPRLFSEGSRAQAAPADGYRQLSLFGTVFERVRAEYVEKPDDAKLVTSALNGMLSELDPHSGYMDANSFRNMQVDTRGEFGGLGIEVTMEEGLLKVVAPIDETPAAKAGIMSNDIITHLDESHAFAELGVTSSGGRTPHHQPRWRATQSVSRADSGNCPVHPHPVAEIRS